MRGDWGCVEGGQEESTCLAKNEYVRNVATVCGGAMCLVWVFIGTVNVATTNMRPRKKSESVAGG